MNKLLRFCRVEIRGRIRTTFFLYAICSIIHASMLDRPGPSSHDGKSGEGSGQLFLLYCYMRYVEAKIVTLLPALIDLLPAARGTCS
jgi:hypothetical protein